MGMAPPHEGQRGPLAMTDIFHVCTAWDGSDLSPLAKRLGEAEAIEAWLERWPEGGDLVHDHVHAIHLYDTLEAAQEHADAFGGTVLAIDAQLVELDRDIMEFDHPITRAVIPARAIREA